MKVTGTNVIHVITVTRFMQAMPILTLCRAQQVLNSTYSDPHFFTDELLAGCGYMRRPHPHKFTNSNSDFSCYMQNCTFSFRMSYVEDIKVECESYKWTSYSPHICQWPMNTGKMAFNEECSNNFSCSEKQPTQSPKYSSHTGYMMLAVI